MTEAGTVQVNGNNSLTSLQGLGNLATVRTLNIGYGVAGANGNLNLTSLAGLESLTSLTFPGSVSIAGHPNVTSLAPLSNLGGIVSTLRIQEMTALTSLGGLESVVEVDSLFVGGGPDAVDDLPLLVDLSSLSGAPLTGNVNLTNLRNDVSLSSLNGTTSSRWTIRDSHVSGLDGIAAPGEVSQLSLSNINTPTDDLTGLENLTTVSGQVRIEDGNLLNLGGLENLTTITGGLTVEQNEALATLAGLDDLQTLGGSLRIRFNDTLLQCEAEAFRDDLINNHGYTGSANISGNAVGVCN